MAVIPHPEDITPQRLQQMSPDLERHDAVYWRDGSQVYFGRDHPVRHARVERCRELHRL